MLVKYIDRDRIKEADKYEVLFYDNIQVINPREEDFIKAGYKELVQEEEPIYDEETQYIFPYYEEKENRIEKKWDVFGIPEEDNEA